MHLASFTDPLVRGKLAVAFAAVVPSSQEQAVVDPHILGNYLITGREMLQRLLLGPRDILEERPDMVTPESPWRALQFSPRQEGTADICQGLSPES